MAGGGAWKVAYADFITALFALFLVLWILNQDEEEKGISSSNFLDPWQTITQKSTRIIKVSEDHVMPSRESQFKGDSPVPLKFQRVPDENVIKTFMNNKEIRDNRCIKVEQVNEGVLISFFDNFSNEPMFEDKVGPNNKPNPILTQRGLISLRSVGWLISRYNMDGGKGSDIEINSHTEKGRKDPWEMSTKQASLVFDELVNVGVQETQVVKIAGLGDTTPMTIDNSPLEPNDKRNRRFEILVRTKPELH